MLVFLREHGLLLADPSPQSQSEIRDDFQIRASMLTPLGLEVMKTGYDNWLKNLDRGGARDRPTTLVRVLEKLMQEP